MLNFIILVLVKEARQSSGPERSKRGQITHLVQKLRLASAAGEKGRSALQAAVEHR